MGGNATPIAYAFTADPIFYIAVRSAMKARRLAARNGGFGLCRSVHRSVFLKRADAMI
jgi:hypothetical protein